MKLTSRIVQRTLAYVNRIRAKQGRKPLKRLPKGRRMSPYACPIATAITVGGSRVRAYGDSVEYVDAKGVHRQESCPLYVSHFVEAFDSGRIPELIRR